MSLSFVIWAMETFSDQSFGMCGKTIGSFRRNVLFWLKLMLKSRGFVLKKTTAVYFNPIVKLETETETEDEAPALTVYLKRDTNVESSRASLARKTDVSVDKHYAAALSNTSKVVLAKIKK